MKRRIAVAIAAVAVAASIGIVGVEVNRTSVSGWAPSSAHEIAATQDIKYHAVSVANTGWGKSRSLPDTLSVVRGDLARHAGEGFTIKQKQATTWGPVRSLDATMGIFKDRLSSAAVDRIWLARAVKDNYTEKAKKVDLNPAKVIDTEGTQAIDIIVGTAATRYPSVLNYGIAACKRIAGSYSWSQHAYNNGVDFGGSTALLNDVANYLNMLRIKHYVPAAEILWQGRNLVNGHFVSDHFDHVHVSGSPLMYGTPACAR